MPTQHHGQPPEFRSKVALKRLRTYGHHGQPGPIANWLATLRRPDDYLGYDAFALCGVRDPYVNETIGVASLITESLGQRLKNRRLTLKLTVKSALKGSVLTQKRSLDGRPEHTSHFPDTKS